MTKDALTAELLGAIATRRDRAAFRTLYRRTSARLFGIVLRITGGRALADPVFRDLWSELWFSARRFTPDEAGADAWLTGLARDRAIAAVRRHGRAQPGPEDRGIDPMAEAADPFADRERAATLAALLERLDVLDNRQRKALLFAYYEGRSHEDLAERFDTPINTVKAWLRRALDALRDGPRP